MITDWRPYYPYFQEHEFDSHDVPNSGRYFDKQTLLMLLNARLLVESDGVQFKINSACRSEWWNAKIGGVSNSEHLYVLKDGKLIKPCTAVDIGFTKRNFHIIIESLVRVGFNRFGISFSDMFIHADNSKTKTQKTSWDYDPNTQMLRTGEFDDWDR